MRGDRVYRILTNNKKISVRHADHIITNNNEIVLDDPNRLGDNSKDSTSYDHCVYGKSKIMNICDQSLPMRSVDDWSVGENSASCTNEHTSNQFNAINNQSSAALNLRQKPKRNIKAPDRLNL